MDHQLIASAKITIPATLEKVWETVTNPLLIAEFLYGTKTSTDW